MVQIDGKQYSAHAGQSLISVFIENECFALKANQVTGEARFGICGMGTCFECEVHIDGMGIRRACMTAIRSDLNIKTGPWKAGE